MLSISFLMLHHDQPPGTRLDCGQISTEGAWSQARHLRWQTCVRTDRAYLSARRGALTPWSGYRTIASTAPRVRSVAWMSASWRLREHGVQATAPGRDRRVGRGRRDRVSWQTTRPRAPRGRSQAGQLDREAVYDDARVAIAPELLLTASPCDLCACGGWRRRV